ncbi:MAG: hypothetical protein ACJA1C_002156 [Crocinitomicaceae bacterium]|jgi:hypothetical protein
MTQNEYDALLLDTTPHAIFEDVWSSYSSIDFITTFLPKVAPSASEGIRIIDGARVFTRPLASDKFQLTGAKDGYRVNCFSFPKDAPASSNKEKVTVGDLEMNVYLEVEMNDGINVIAQIGTSLKEKLKLMVGEKKSFKTNFSTGITALRGGISGSLTQRSFSEYIFNELGYELKSVSSRLSFKALEDAFKILENDFDAGEVRSPSNPESWAHGDIERRALKGLYKDYEIDQIYYGNWLRDYSSVISANSIGFNPNDIKIFRDNSTLKNRESVKINRALMGTKFSHYTWSRIIKVMAVKAFKYDRISNPPEDYHDKRLEENFESRFGDITKNILGVYRPEEHIDNPKGLIDETPFSSTLLNEPVFYNYEYKKNKKNRKTLYPGELPASIVIGDDMIKPYIIKEFDGRPSSLTFVKQQLRLAAECGKNKTGLRHLGAAFHVMEDFFAHTNFVEIALIKQGYLDVHPWVELSIPISAIEIGHDKACNIPLVTGLFGSDDLNASLAPKIADELFPTTIEAYKKLKFGDRTFFDVMLILVLNDYIEKDKGLPKSKKSKFGGYTYAEIKAAYKVYLGTRDKWLLAIALDYTGILENIDRLTHTLAQGLAFYPRVLANSMAQSIPNDIKNRQSKQTGYGSNPTHTQLAKDPADHFFNPLAGKLAYIVVKEIGSQMLEVWKGSKTVTIDSVIKNIETELFVHPCELEWIDKIVKDWAKKHPQAIKDSKNKKSSHSHFHNGFEQFNKAVEKQLNLSKAEIKDIINAEPQV